MTEPGLLFLRGTYFLFINFLIMVKKNLSSSASLSAKIQKINTLDNFGEFDDIFREDDKSAYECITEAINDFLQYVGVTPTNYPQYLENRNDFHNDQNDQGAYFCDLAHEWADNQVDIYYCDIWSNAGRFQHFSEEYCFQFGSECASQAIKDGGVSRLLQQIQYTAYSNFAYRVLSLLNDDREG